jgi:excisionase family DNA binding protein
VRGQARFVPDAGGSALRRLHAGHNVTGQLLTAREVGELLGVSAETALRWTRRGDLPGIRLPGGAIRYREADLDAWLAARATPRREAPATAPGAAALRVRSAPPVTTTREEQ